MNYREPEGAVFLLKKSVAIRLLSVMVDMDLAKAHTFKLV
jgi:hypothetical protein